MCNQPTIAVAGRLDPLQFAYWAGSGVEDTALTPVNVITNHLDTTGSYVRVLFMNFSYAFSFYSAACIASTAFGSEY